MGTLGGGSVATLWGSVQGYSFFFFFAATFLVQGVTGDIVCVFSAQSTASGTSLGMQRTVVALVTFGTFRDELYLLQAEHQRSSTLHLIRLPAPVDGLLDDVSKIVIVLRTEKQVLVMCLLAKSAMLVSLNSDHSYLLPFNTGVI